MTCTRLFALSFRSVSKRSCRQEDAANARQQAESRERQRQALAKASAALEEVSGRTLPAGVLPVLTQSVMESMQQQNCTPLHEAVSVSSIEIVRLLLEHGADPTVPDIKGKTVEELAKTVDIDDDIRRAVAEAASRVKATSGKQRSLRRTTEEAVAITLSGFNLQ